MASKSKDPWRIDGVLAVIHGVFAMWWFFYSWVQWDDGDRFFAAGFFSLGVANVLITAFVFYRYLRDRRRFIIESRSQPQISPVDEAVDAERH